MKNSFLHIGLALCILSFSSCIEHTKEDHKTDLRFDVPESSKPLEAVENSKVRIFKGNIPCADCSGIEQRLVLKGDTLGVYRLSEVYKNATDDGDGHLVSRGEWKIVNKKGKSTLYIYQGHLGDSVRTACYEYSDKKLVQNDMDGEPIKSKWNYALKRVRSN